MPLFGKNKNSDGYVADSNTTDNHSRLTKHHQDPNYPSANAPAPMSAAGDTRMGHGTGTTTGNNMTGAGYGGTAAGHGGLTHNDAGAAAYPMAPQTDISGNPTHPGSAGRGGGGSRMIGKIESAIGSAVGSQSLKQRGLAKEQEGNALKAQAGELGEAERLEREAHARRERAVAHGAHPDHGQAGMNPGVSAANAGGGAGYGATGGGGYGATGAGGTGGTGSAARGGY